MSRKGQRLYAGFQPSHYILTLEIDPDALRFTGTVEVSGKKVGRPSQRITLHQHGLKVTSASIVKHDKKGNQAVDVTRINLHASYDEVRLHSAQQLYAGSYTISLEFAGEITKTMEGMYPCYFRHDGQDKKLIATQFESHHARQAFPCVDEPEAKATFDLTIVAPAGRTVLANTPIRQQDATKTQMTTVFETTPVMSPYLLAFVWGELHSVTGKSACGVEVRSWATVAQPKAHLAYANQETIRCLDFFEGYFQTLFPLPKLDQVALPDFDALAMENWGLITFRERVLLADPTNRSISAERLITQVIAHEMSHQWFGNLVTMKWWDDLWLNESFATVMESLAPDKLHPDWNEWEDFTATRVLAAADRDIYADVQPVGLHVKQPDEIQTLFDPSIVYAKGARILKMLMDLIGEAAFRRGLASYFKKYAYKNTEGADLWQELSAASQLDIGALMAPWIAQSGTPELSVAMRGTKLQLTQKRFLLDGEDAEAIWPIPLLADRKLSPPVMVERAITIAAEGQSDMPLFNPSGSAHFITHYEDAAAQVRVQAMVKDRALASQGRIIALSDMLLLARKGEGSLVAVLELVANCDHEDRDAVWAMSVRAITSAHTLSSGNERLEKKLRHYSRQLAEHWYDKLGWEDRPSDDPNTKHLRATILSLSVAGENQAALDAALAKFEVAATVEALPAEQRQVIASAAVRFGDSATPTKLMHEYETSQNPDVKASIAAALCSTRSPDICRQIVSWGMFDDRIIKPQDIDRFFMYLMQNRHTRSVAWQWLEKRWPYLIEQFGEGKKMEYFIWHASRPLSSPDWEKRYHEFFEPKQDDMSLRRNIAISLAEIAARVEWRKREEPRLERYFGISNSPKK